MEQKVKAGDYVILTDPISYGKDERIRDMLLRHIQRARGSLTNDEAGECIEWLKKQGNKNLHGFAMPIGEVNNNYNMKQAEMLKDKHDIDWEQRRYEIAKEMMPYCARELIDVLNSSGKNEEWVGKTIAQIASESAVGYADALIDRLKRKEEQ